MQPLHSQGELTQQLEMIGWKLQRLDIKNGMNVAKGKGPAGQTIQAVGQSPEMAVFGLLTQAERANQVRRFAAIKAMGAWSQNWVDDKQQIARAYAEMPAYDQKAADSWIQLGNESIAQATSIRQRIHIEETDEPNPYHSIDELITDVHHNQHYTVSRANSQHPVWSEDQVIAFRIVNDVVAHCQARAGWDWDGVNAAAQVHMPIVSAPAREALFVETVAHEAYMEQYPGHDVRKVGFLSDHLNQQVEGEHVHAPATSDVVALSKVAMTPWNDYPDIDPNTPEDPNQFWQSPYAATPNVPSGSEGDYINREDVVGNANKLRNPGREWWEQDPETQRLAILNAFKTSILSPLKHLKWNTAHYQGLADMAPTATAREMWDRLDDVRESHNQLLGAMPGEHIGGLKKLAKKLADVFKAEGQHPAEAWRYAKDLVYRETSKVEEQLKQEYHDAGEELTDLRLHLDARKIVEDWVASLVLSKGAEPEPHVMEAATKGSAWAEDYEGLERLSSPLPYDPQTAPPEGGTKYGGFMGNHILAIASISQYLEPLRQYAQKDIKEDGGRGYIFRAGVKHLGIKGADDKVASFAWLLLAPHTSDLSILDTHALRSMGLTEDATNRVNAYHAIERGQRTMRDLSGYSDLPHGQYHWGMWDAIRTPGHVSDHSGFRVLDPEPWWELDWQDATSAKTEPIWHGPQILEDARVPAEIERAKAHAELGNSSPKETIYQRIRNGEIIPGITHVKDKQTKKLGPNPLYAEPDDLWQESEQYPGYYTDGTPIQTVSKVQATSVTKSDNPMATLIDSFVSMKPTNKNDAIRLGSTAKALHISNKDFQRFLKVQEEDAAGMPGWKSFKREALTAFNG